MLPPVFNLLTHLPEPGPDEHFTVLLETPAVRIERIVSDQHSSAPDFWYDQPHDEWVVLLQGEAELTFSEGGVRTLTAGDALCIPARCRHRIARTGLRTVWLAVHVLTGSAS